MNYTWSITGLFAHGTKVTRASFSVLGTDGTASATYEDEFTFKEGTVNKPLADCTENDVIGWIQQDATNDGVNWITSLVDIKVQDSVIYAPVALPWGA